MVHQDLEDFAALALPEADGIAHVRADRLTRRVAKELVVSKQRLAAYYIGGAVFGYLFSLTVCAQCTVGMSPLAWKTASVLHKIPDPWCPLLCGAIFGIAPSLAAGVWLTRFQHRYLLFKMWWLVLLVPFVGSVSMASLGAEHDTAWQMLWLTSAILTPFSMEAVYGFFLRQKQFISA